MNTTKRIVRFIEGELLQGGPHFGDPLASGLIDSLLMEQLIGFIEHDFKIRFEDEDLLPEHFARLDALVALVEAKSKAKP